MLRQLQRSLRANDVRALVSTTAATAEAGPAATGDAPSRFTWRDSLKYRVRKAFQADAEQPEQQAVHAGVLLERYPICLPEVPQWRHDFAHWQSDWNAWRYKVAKKGWLDTTQRAADDQSQEARTPPPRPTRTTRLGCTGVHAANRLLIVPAPSSAHASRARTSRPRA